ncbi:MAG TPA: DUF6754 domain-containing protein [Candidatus Limnocylindria bacterium]
MPTPADVVAEILAFVSDVLGSSSLRLGVGPTLLILGVILVFLQLVARPITRWVTTDAGGLAAVARSMAVAAEAGTDAVVTLGSGGLTRSTDAFARLQTLAALPTLGHVVRAAARSGVALRVLVNDPLTEVAARTTLDAAHERTSTLERVGRSRVVLTGEGRLPAAGLVMTSRARPAAAIAVGSLREEATLHLEGLRGTAGAMVSGTAEAAQAAAPVFVGGGVLIGPELFQVAGDLRSDVNDRSVALAANRLIGLAVVTIIAASVLALTGLIEPSDLLLGIGRP